MDARSHTRCIPSHASHLQVLFNSLHGGDGLQRNARMQQVLHEQKTKRSHAAGLAAGLACWSCSRSCMTHAAGLAAGLACCSRSCMFAFCVSLSLFLCPSRQWSLLDRHNSALQQSHFPRLPSALSGKQLTSAAALHIATALERFTDEDRPPD